MEPNKPRIGFMFHETFKLTRKPMSEILDLSKDFNNQNKRKLTFSDIKEKSLLGNNYIKAFPHYLRGCGLIDFSNNLLTSLGKQVIQHDPLISDSKSLWLLHYHMSMIDGPGPEFWNHLFISFFKPGNNFSRNEIKEAIATLYWESAGKLLAEKSINSTTYAFLNSYIHSDGLGNLTILSKITEEYFSVNQPYFQYVWVLAYALSDFWSKVYPDNNSVSLDRLLDSELPKYFFLSKEEFETMLNELKFLGFLDIHRTAQPFQVFLKYGIEYTLMKLYENG